MFVFVFLSQLHIVNVRSNFANVSQALEDSQGLAVLGFFIEVRNLRWSLGVSSV